MVKISPTSLLAFSVFFSSALSVAVPWPAPEAEPGGIEVSTVSASKANNLPAPSDDRKDSDSAEVAKVTIEIDKSAFDITDASNQHSHHLEKRGTSKCAQKRTKRKAKIRRLRRRIEKASVENANRIAAREEAKASLYRMGWQYSPAMTPLHQQIMALNEKIREVNKDIIGWRKRLRKLKSSSLRCSNKKNKKKSKKKSKKPKKSKKKSKKSKKLKKLKKKLNKKLKKLKKELSKKLKKLKKKTHMKALFSGSR